MQWDKQKQISAPVMMAHHTDFELTIGHFDHPEWTKVGSAQINRKWSGEDAPYHRHAEARIIWSATALMARFVCRQYEPLIVNSDPQLDKKTIGLWERDVCEIFIAPGASVAERYFEFEAAPTGEWVDLAINFTSEGRRTDFEFHSGMTAAAKVKEDEIVISMCIPWSALIPRPKHGDEWRANLFRCVGSRRCEHGLQDDARAPGHADDDLPGFPRVGGRVGIAAGVSFILPSFLIVLGMSALYVHRGMAEAASPERHAGQRAGGHSRIVPPAREALPREALNASVIGSISLLLILTAPAWEPLVILFFGILGGFLLRLATGPGFRPCRRVCSPSAPFRFSPKAVSRRWPGCSGSASSRAPSYSGSGLAIVPLLEADVVRTTSGSRIRNSWTGWRSARSRRDPW